jgi:hypothetical protein
MTKSRKLPGSGGSPAPASRHGEAALHGELDFARRGPARRGGARVRHVRFDRRAGCGSAVLWRGFSAAGQLSALAMLKQTIDSGYCSFPAAKSDPMFASLLETPQIAAAERERLVCQDRFQKARGRGVILSERRPHRPFPGSRVLIIEPESDVVVEAGSKICRSRPSR